jgi:hypothetical protein
MSEPGDGKFGFALLAEADEGRVQAPRLMSRQDDMWFFEPEHAPANIVPKRWMTRDDYVEEAKREAMKLLMTGKFVEAIIHMAIKMKLAAHAEGSASSVVDSLLPLATLYLRNSDFKGLRSWIDGFR